MLLSVAAVASFCAKHNKLLLVNKNRMINFFKLKFFVNLIALF